MNTSSILIDTIGWLGATLVLLAYALLSVRWMDGNSFSYQALNVTGAVMLVVNSYYLGAYPSVGVNAAWVGIALLTLFRAWWTGSTDAVKKVAAKFPKRVNIRKIAVKQIKLPAFKREKRDRPAASKPQKGFPQIF